MRGFILLCCICLASFAAFSQDTYVKAVSAEPADSPANRYSRGFSISDSVFCAGNCITFPRITAGATEYYWTFSGGNPSFFNGKIPPPVCYAKPGTYFIKLSIGFRPGGNSNWNNSPAIMPEGAYSTDSASVRVLPAEAADAGFDTVLCSFQSLILDAGNPGSAYLWSNGDKKHSISPSSEGTYSVKIYNPCFFSEFQFRVIYLECNPTYFVPSAFTPDGDGLNDYFTARGDYITVTRIKIFNRWGQKQFETEGKNVSWDGFNNNKKCEQGEYIFLMEIKGADGQMYYPTGTVQLLE